MKKFILSLVLISHSSFTLGVGNELTQETTHALNPMSTISTHDSILLFSATISTILVFAGLSSTVALLACGPDSKCPSNASKVEWNLCADSDGNNYVPISQCKTQFLLMKSFFMGSVFTMSAGLGLSILFQAQPPHGMNKLPQSSSAEFLKEPASLITDRSDQA